MLQHRLPLLLLICLLSLLVLSGCQSDAPLSVLPNLLVRVDGEVEVIRKERPSISVPITLGAELEPGDTVLLKSGQAAIFCGNETSWEQNPIRLPLGKHFKVTCQEGRVQAPRIGSSVVREGKDSIGQPIPYAVSPRSGSVLQDKPAFRWHLLPGVEHYTVTLSSNDSQIRPPITVTRDEWPLPYPTEWPPLKGKGAEYRLKVEGNVARSEKDEIDGIDGDGFFLLESAEAKQIEDLSQRLHEHNLSSPSETLLLAHLYLHDDYKLRSNAIELLLAVPNGDQLVVVQRLLGQTYLQMGLLDEATAAYSRALTLAEEANLPEEQASGHQRLSLLTCVQRDKKKASSHKQKAEALYGEMGWAEEDVEVLFAKVEGECKRLGGRF